MHTSGTRRPTTAEAADDRGQVRADKLRPAQAARYIGVSISTLAKWRSLGIGPVFEKCGPKLVYYYRRDLDAWMQTRKRSSTRSATPPQRE